MVDLVANGLLMLSLAGLGFPSLTPMSSFNSWSLSLAAYRNGEMERSALEGEFHKFWSEMLQISSVFRSEVLFQEREPEVQRLIQQSLKQLSLCEELCCSLGTESQHGEQVSQEILSALGEALTGLFDRFSQIREWEERQPRLAASPFIHELLRCIQMYDQGRLAPKLLSQRLASVQHHFQQLSQQIESSPLRLPAVEQLLDILDLQRGAFEELSSHLTAGQRPLPAPPQQILRQCAQEAQNIHQEILDLQGQSAGWCSRCQGIVLAESGVCPECGQALGMDSADRGVAGLVELANLACQQGQPEDWAHLLEQVRQSVAQLEEVKKKAESLPERPAEVEDALIQLEQVLLDVQGSAENRDRESLVLQIQDLQQALDHAQSAQSQARKELS